MRLNQAAADRRAAGLEVIDFGMGDPREPTDPRIIAALRDGVRERMGYPAAVGLPELRDAVAGWAGRRFGASLDPERHVVPTLGSKEAIFSFAQVVLDLPRRPRHRRRDRARLPGRRAWRPVRRGARGGAAIARGATASSRTWTRFPTQPGREPRSCGSTTPTIPTGATATLAFYERLAALAREHEFVLASDEAYSELWFDEPPVSALQLPDWTNVAVFNTLSKRSSMTGYRSGFVAGDPELVAALKQFRPNVGTAPQEFVQRAAVVAWSDEEHVERARAAYGRKRKVFLDLFARTGLRNAGGPTTMYLWVATPAGETSEGFAARLLDHGVLVAPGSFLGGSGEGYVRFALVPTDDECARAVEILDRVL